MYVLQQLVTIPRPSLFCSESANEYTDDEDVSWKVRRAAAKCLAALIVSRPELLSKLFEEVAPCSLNTFFGHHCGCQ